VQDEVRRQTFQGRGDAKGKRASGRTILSDRRKRRIVEEWWRVDEYLATPEEIENLADGTYSFAELEECYMKRRADEARAAGSP
jgi:hypothetical protein